MQTNIIKTALLAIIALSLNFNANAKIWRLNNNGNNPIPVIVGDFTTSSTLQQAHDNASVMSGDTIHVEQSPTTYGPCIFTKRLIVIGAGYFLNQNPNTQVNTSFGSSVGILTFNNIGSAGSEVWGLTVGNVFAGQSNLTIARCYFPSAILYVGNSTPLAINNLNLRQNKIEMQYAAGTPGISTAPGTIGLATNVNIVSNIITANTGFTGTGINLPSNVSGLIKNNIVYTYTPINVSNFYVANNLFNGGMTFNNCNIEYNISVSPIISSAGGGNTFGSGNLTRTWAQVAFLSSPSSDGSYQLGASSVAIGAGNSGVDCGAFGGDYPYKLSGIAPIPNIYALSIAPIAAGASSISVTVTAKGNNF